MNCAIFTEQAVTNGSAVVSDNSTVRFPRRLPGDGTTRPTVSMVRPLLSFRAALSHGSRKAEDVRAPTEQLAERELVRGGDGGDLHCQHQRPGHAGLVLR
jgi:hypothetical protein